MATTENKIAKVIGVGSGKGGVGKSTVSALLALALAERGMKVGVMDADITGPSAPRLLGIESFRADSDGTHIIPIVNEEGVKVMSINLVLEDETKPVIWRGPLLSKAVQQFYTDTAWGELDVLVVDLPPGTGDVLITAMQALPLAGVVFATFPQDLVAMIVSKAVNMAKSAGAKVLGVAENMGTFVCPECGVETPLFSDGTGSDRLGLPVLGRFPWRREIVAAHSLRWADLSDAAKSDARAFADAVLAAADASGATPETART